MLDFATARRTMVDNQLRTHDVTNSAILDAMDLVPRERFVPEALRPLAYRDDDAEVAAAKPGHPARFVMMPAPFAKLLQLASIAPGDRVLVVGCATGYSVAVIAELAASVVGVEQDADLARAAGATLTGLGLATASIVTGALTEGAAAAAPFDVIVVEGAVEVLPEALKRQLADRGRLVVIEGAGPSAKAMLYTRSGGDVAGRAVFNAAAKPLPGFARAAEFVF